MLILQHLYRLPQSGWSEIRQPSPPTDVKPAIQSHAALPLTHYMVWGWACVDFWVTYMWALYSASLYMCVCLCSVCILTVPLSVLLQLWLIRSYSNNQLYFTSLFFFPPIHCVCVRVFEPPHHHHCITTSSHQNGQPICQLSPLCFHPVLTERSNSGSLSRALTLILIHWYASRISGAVIPLMTPLQSLTPSLSQLVSPHHAGSCYV